MAAADPKAVDLSVNEHDRVERLLADFDRDWADGQLALNVGRLPAVGHPLRAPALLGLLRIEIERQWERGGSAELEAYLEQYPELGTRDSVPVSLILQEYRARLRFGSAPDLDEFARRFPHQADDLRRFQKDNGDDALRDSKRDSQSEAPTLAPLPAPLAPARVASPRVASPAFMSPSAPNAPSVGESKDDGPVLPEQFDRYRIIKKLGHGGMGAVYLAHDTKLDRRVALKVPKFSPDSDPDNLERFYREARATATIHHPNLCPLHDVGEFNGMPYLTMAYIEGWPLSHFVRPDKRLPQAGTAALVRTVALAVAEAHKLGIVHRDLKPGNILVDKRGQPIVMDFGLARWVNADKDDVRLTKSGAILGAPVYMSPEQVYGDVENMGPSCDVYALGVILYELLTGRLPFEGGTTAVLAKTLMQPPVPPSKYRPDLDPRLEAICLKALAKQIHERYATMTEMAAALADFLKAEKQEREGGSSISSLSESGRLRMSQPPSGTGQKAPSSAPPRSAVVTPMPGQPGYPAFPADPPSGARRGEPERQTPSPSGRETLAQGPRSDVRKPSPKAVIPTSADDRSALADPSESFVRRVSPKPLPQIKHIRQTHSKQLWRIGGGVALVLAIAGVLTWLLWPAPAPVGTVQVSIKPDGANPRVELDTTGVDPNLVAVPFELKPGTHKLIVTAEGFEPFTREFTVNKDNNSHIDVELKPKVVAQPKPPTPPPPPPPDKVGAQQFRPFNGHTDVVESVAFTPDGKRALSASWDKTVRVWNVANGQQLASFPEHQNKVHAVTVSRDGKRALSAGWDSQVRLWNLENLKPLGAFKGGHTKEAQSVAFSPNGKRAVSGGSDNLVLIWDVEKGIRLQQCVGHQAPVWAVAFLPDDKHVLSASYDKTVRKWEAATGKQVAVWTAPDGLHALAVSGDGKLALVAGRDKAVHLLDVAAMKHLHSFQGHTSIIAGVALSADGRWGLSGGDDKTAILWDVQNRRQLDRFTRAPDSILSVAFAPDGKTALLGGRDKVLRLWTLPAR